MNKTEMIKAIAERTGVTKKDVEAVVGAFTDVVTDVMASGDKITLIGFGTFEAVDKPERTARNPRTGETMTIKASKSPKFKAGKALKDAVNK